LELINDRGIQPTIIEYLNTPPDKSELKNILTLLNLKPRDLMRHKEQVYREMNLDDPNLSDEALIDAMIQNPILIERPIVITNGKAALGRPPETILEIL
jgi:arsenate reductase